MTLIFPWPYKGLSPNDRPHRMELARIKKRYRSACGWTAVSQGAGPMKAEALKVHLVFYPPTNRNRDEDNLVAAMKSGLDGLADVLRVDDSRWKLTHEIAPQLLAGGMVRVEITE
jgi:crossover junction endodeoxyribonuclease RusA